MANSLLNSAFSLFSFIGENADKIYLSNSIVQSGSNLYSSRKPENFERINKIQWIFSTVNVGALFVSIHQIFSAIPLDMIYMGQNMMLIAGSCSLVIVGYAIKKTIEYINKKSMPTTDIKDWLKTGQDSDALTQENADPQINAIWHHPDMKQFNQATYILQLITSVALIVISASSYFYAMSAISYGYSLYKTSNQVWIKLEYQRIPILGYNRENPGPTAFNFNYTFPIFLNRDAQATCDKCYKINPTAAFHGRHLFHPFCIIEDLNEKRPRVFRSRGRRLLTNHYKNGVYQNTTVSYKYNLPKNILPTCPKPSCGIKPSLNELNLTVEDVQYAPSQATINYV